jgi:tetratricopeptide (TPR) repeat protein
MAGFGSRELLWWCALGLAACLLAAAPAAAQSLSDRLLADARDGQLDEFEFVSAALVAGGVDDECELGGWLDLYRERRAALLNDLRLDDLLKSTPASRLQAIHAALHKTLLTGTYQADASDLRLALSRGDFNCLSSLAIYFDLCQAAGLKIEIWQRRGHVFLRHGEFDVAVSVEPGARDWAALRPVRRNQVRPLSPTELLGKFYYNRGVQLLQRQQFAEGLELLQISVTLDPADGDARANIVAGLNNWAVVQCQRQRYEQAAALIERGLTLDPTFAPLVANQQLVRAKLRK